MPSIPPATWLIVTLTALSGAACAQILGNDFCRSDEADCPTTAATTNTGGSGGSGGTGPTGGAGGAGGDGGSVGGGGMGPEVLDCALIAGRAPVELASLETMPVAQQWEERLLVVALNDDGIFITLQRVNPQPVIELFQIGKTGLQLSVGGNELFDVVPIGDGEVGILYDETGSLVFRRSLSGVSETVATQSSLMASLDDARATLASNGQIAIVASSSDGSDARALFGLYNATAIPMPRFTTPDINLGDSDVRPAGLVRQANINHVFLGEGEIGSSGRYYTITDGAVTESTPVQVFPDGLQVIQATAVSGSTVALAVRDANVGEGLTIRFATIPFDDLATAAIDEFPITAQLTAADVPPGSEPLLTETHLTFAGGVVGDDTLASMLVVGFADGVQAKGTFALLAEIPGAEEIDAMVARPRDGFPINPQLDVVVMTSHGAGSFKKLHTLEVACSAP